MSTYLHTISTVKALTDVCSSDYGEGGYGQNMGYGYNHIGKLLTNAMYNGEMMAFAGSYGAAQPANSDFSAWGHFTQMVWQKTEKVGCYTHTCQALTDPNHGKPIPNTPFTVCNYSPPGMFLSIVAIPGVLLTVHRQLGWRVRHQRPQASRPPDGRCLNVVNAAHGK